MDQQLPPAELVAAAKKLLYQWRPDYPWPPGDPHIVISLILQYVPDEWAKVNGRWVQLEKPEFDRDAYDFVRPDWYTLNEALEDRPSRIRMLPSGTFCICTKDKTCALHGRD